MVPIVWNEERGRIAAEKQLAETKKMEKEKAEKLKAEERSAVLMQKHGRSFLAKKKVAGIYEAELRKTMTDFTEATGGSEFMTFTQALNYHDIHHWLEDGSLRLPNLLSSWKTLPEKFPGDSINFEVRHLFNALCAVLIR
jgi:hypothetical protein